MPFKSEKQRRYLWAKHPDIARRWADEYGSDIEKKALSEHVKKKQSKRDKK